MSIIYVSDAQYRNSLVKLEYPYVVLKIDGVEQRYRILSASADGIKLGLEG